MRLLVAVLILSLALPAVAHAGFYVRARIETPGKTVYRGNVWVGRNYIEDSEGVHSITQHTAISTIDDAARRAGFPYSVVDKVYGLYVESVDSLAETTTSTWFGWLYRVNGLSPMFGSADYLLKPGDDVLWYYGAFDTTPLAVRVASRAAINTTVTVTALELDLSGVATTPVSEATVCVGSRVATTNASGQAEFKMTRAGSYGVRAEKDGYVRSDVRYVSIRHRSYASFYARPAMIRRGRLVNLIGVLRSQGVPLPGRRVAIQYKYGSGWRTVRWLATRRNGVFNTRLAPARTTYYRAVWAGDSSHLPVTSVARRVAVVR